MGFNRRKIEDQRRDAAEKQAESRRATDAERLIAARRRECPAAYSLCGCIRNLILEG